MGSEAGESSVKEVLRLLDDPSDHHSIAESSIFSKKRRLLEEQNVQLWSLQEE
jgi:hypothetical protein